MVTKNLNNENFTDFTAPWKPWRSHLFFYVCIFFRRSTKRRCRTEILYSMGIKSAFKVAVKQIATISSFQGKGGFSQSNIHHLQYHWSSLFIRFYDIEARRPSCKMFETFAKLNIRSERLSIDKAAFGLCCCEDLRSPPCIIRQEICVQSILSTLLVAF